MPVHCRGEYLPHSSPPPSMFSVASSRKRTRDDDNDDEQSLATQEDHLDKRTRQSVGRPGDDEKWYHGHHDSVLSTPIIAREQPQYDSDDQDDSSLISEPGSPQDVYMSSGDEMDDDTSSQSPDDNILAQPRPGPWNQRLRTNRVPTPIVSMRPSARALQRSGPRQHIRQRHPQEIISSDHLEVPSPVDEDEVPTPPSAAEAAGSQLSMLTVSDVDMDESDLIPTISIDPARPSSRTAMPDSSGMLDTVPEFEPMDSTGGIVVRKQRQRSGALSSGNSPVRAGPSNPSESKLRGFSVGYRADCEKCKLRVPGHMNHFI